ncbi:uncharacterized protein LOC124441462 [Xenia sp. Carnegie-2017]|uniref:uncharacterized protein LOC124441462 n=1 Tax=Xenia sp. Carnegie-2017 TaxID=2897299 RepID=UPI001F03FCDA|nr:uncharacterized protein LOC124441462 [Xenia sp. Carnegie-2017]
MNSTILLNYIGDIPRMSAGMMCPIVKTDYRCQANRTRWSRVGDQAVKTGIHPPILSHTSIATSTLSPVTASEFQLYNQQPTRQITNFNKKNKILSKEITVSDKCWKRSTGSVELHFNHKQTHFSSDNNDFTNFETPNLGKISKSFKVKKTPLSSLETLTDSTLYTSQQTQTSVIKYQAKHKKPVTTSKRACLLPATSNHAKRPKRCEKQKVCTNYGNDEMDVARIMISDIPFPVVSCNSTVIMYHNALLDSRTTSTSKFSGEITTKRRGKVTDQSSGETTMKRTGTLADQSNSEITIKRTGTLADQSNSEITIKRTGTLADQSNGEITIKRTGTLADQSNGEITIKRTETLADQSNSEITIKRTGTLADQSNSKITIKRTGTLADQSNSEITIKRTGTLADLSSGEITMERSETLADQSSGEITMKRRDTSRSKQW